MYLGFIGFSRGAKIRKFPEKSQVSAAGGPAFF
jgi:hypothetical protein